MLGQPGSLLTRAPDLLTSALGHAMWAQAGCNAVVKLTQGLSLVGPAEHCRPLLVQEDDHPAGPAVLCDLGDKFIPRYAAHRPKLCPLRSLLELLQPLLPARSSTSTNIDPSSLARCCTGSLISGATLVIYNCPIRAWGSHL